MLGDLVLPVCGSGWFSLCELIELESKWLRNTMQYIATLNQIYHINYTKHLKTVKVLSIEENTEYRNLETAI